MHSGTRTSTHIVANVRPCGAALNAGFISERAFCERGECVICAC